MQGFELGKDLTFIEFLDDPIKTAFFKEYHLSMARIALDRGFGVLLETIATWKASQHMVTEVLGLSLDKWKELVTKNVDLMLEVRDQLEAEVKAR